MSSVCLLVVKLKNCEARCALSRFWPVPAPLHSLATSFFLNQDGVTACHCGCSTIRLRPHDYCGAQKKHQGLFFFVHSFLSFQSSKSIRCTRTHAYTLTHTHDSLLLPSLCLFRSQWSFRLDMYCEKLSCSASFFFSFFHSLFFFQLSVINVQVSQYTNRGKEESEEWGMNWWMGG